jgi:hypothetical protein
MASARITKTSANPVPKEDSEQIALMRWAVYHPLCRDYLFHIPNGGSRNLLEAVKFKRMGVKRGIPDNFFAVPMGKYHGLWIELKRRIGGKLSDNQLQMMSNLTNQGYKVVIAYGWEQAVEFIESYLKEV